MTRSVLSLAVSALTVTAIGLAAPAGAEPFPDCGAAKAAGYCDIPSDSPHYQSKLDRDGDGLACEC